MKYCRKCGAKLEEDFLYCPVCGETFKESDRVLEPSKDIFQTVVNAIRGNEFRMIQLLAVASAALVFFPWFEIGLTDISRTEAISGDQLVFAVEFWVIDGIIFAAIFLKKWLDRVWILATEAVCAALNMISLLSAVFEIKNFLGYINPIASQATDCELKIQSTGWFKLEVVAVVLIGIVSGYFLYEIKRYHHNHRKAVFGVDTKKSKSDSTIADPPIRKDAENKERSITFHQPPHL